MGAICRFDGGNMISFNILRKKRTLAVTILIAIVILMIILFSLRKETGGNLSVDREGNLLKHSIYSNYVFDNTDKVINIGIQPLYLPTGLISEVMERDMVLQMAGSGSWCGGQVLSLPKRGRCKLFPSK